MKLIVGLGNPGKRFVDSRHNIGFSVVKALSQVYKIPLKKEIQVFCLSGKGRIKNQNVILAMPLTFMNLSGVAVEALLKKYKITPDDLLVVCDDLDLELGRLKIRSFGSSGGHRGLKSVIEALRSEKFPRLRIGVGRPHKDIEPVEYVLSAFTRREKAMVKNIVGRAFACCRVWLIEGINKSMNIFNRSLPAGRQGAMK